ncbi:hypothetical protein LCGC14_1409000 [marine sediment metagenome]|uniref:Uncharacterized protein n=1 Tax=marine sediment metagenome TaxID=412755 RepID=A0A0F9KFS5_9ZZZZ
MSKDNKKIIRVELEYDNKEVHRLTGKEAEKWLEAANCQAVFNSVHGIQFPKLDWEILKKGE